MQPAAPGHIPNEEFFKNHYPKVRGWLNAFTEANQRAKKSTGKLRAACIAEMVNLACRLFDEAIVVIGGEAVPSRATGAAAFFESAGRLRAWMDRGGEFFQEGSREIGVHIDYFHRHVPGRFLDAIFDLQPQSNYLRDCVAHSLLLLCKYSMDYTWSCPDPRETTAFFDHTAVEAMATPEARATMEDVLNLEGWCTPQKAMLLYSLVREHKPQNVVEIGIYGGRSIVPIAAALRDNGAGEVWGIETWSGAGATTHRTSILNDFNWMNIDFARIKKNFLDFILRHDLQSVVRIIEAPSDRCGGLFDRIDFLHIDGNHSTYSAAQDVVKFLPKVPPGGIVVFDDIDWLTTRAGLDILRDTCRLLHVVPKMGDDTQPGCAAFVKI